MTPFKILYLQTNEVVVAVDLKMIEKQMTITLLDIMLSQTQAS